MFGSRFSIFGLRFLVFRSSVFSCQFLGFGFRVTGEEALEVGVSVGVAHGDVARVIHMRKRDREPASTN